VLVTPVLIALVFALIQTALLWNARHTLAAAAQQGARHARTAAALLPISTAATPDADGQLRASTLAYLEQIGGRSLNDPTVTVDRAGEFVTVTVSATTLGLLPGTSIRLSSSSRTPVEGFRP
jgi:Flp pilus assembly protein TadG